MPEDSCEAEREDGGGAVALVAHVRANVLAPDEHQI